MHTACHRMVRMSWRLAYVPLSVCMHPHRFRHARAHVGLHMYTCACARKYLVKRHSLGKYTGTHAHIQILIRAQCLHTHAVYTRCLDKHDSPQTVQRILQHHLSNSGMQGTQLQDSVPELPHPPGLMQHLHRPPSPAALTHGGWRALACMYVPPAKPGHCWRLWVTVRTPNDE